jgi:hypothetical protein
MGEGLAHLNPGLGVVFAFDAALVNGELEGLVFVSWLHSTETEIG